MAGEERSPLAEQALPSAEESPHAHSGPARVGRRRRRPAMWQPARAARKGGTQPRSSVAASNPKIQPSGPRLPCSRPLALRLPSLPFSASSPRPLCSFPPSAACCSGECPRRYPRPPAGPVLPLSCVLFLSDVIFRLLASSFFL